MSLVSGSPKNRRRVKIDVLHAIVLADEREMIEACGIEQTGKRIALRLFMKELNLSNNPIPHTNR